MAEDVTPVPAEVPAPATKSPLPAPYAFALDAIIVVAACVLFFFGKIDETTFSWLVGPIVGGNVLSRTRGGPGAGVAVALVLSLVGALRRGGLAAVAMLGMVCAGCGAFMPSEVDTAVDMLRAECAKSPATCEAAIDGVALQLCPGTDSVRECIRRLVEAP